VSFKLEPFSPYIPVVHKSKFVTMLFSFLPGAGHMYLGQLTRGLTFMMLLVADIVMLTAVVDSHFALQFMLSVFLGLMIPVIVIVSIFDALQQVNYNNAQVRRMQASPYPEQSPYPIHR